MHFAQSKGSILTDLRQLIGDLDRASPIEIGKGFRTPEGLWEWLLGKNGVLMDTGQCLTGGWLIRAFRASDILNTYQFKMKL